MKDVPTTRVPSNDESISYLKRLQLLEHRLSVFEQKLRELIAASNSQTQRIDSSVAVVNRNVEFVKSMFEEQIPAMIEAAFEERGKNETKIITL